MRIRHPARVAQRPSLRHQPLGIRLSRNPAQRPGRGQRPMRICRFQEIGLESAGQSGVPQWSIPWPSCAHSTHSPPDSGPIRMQDADLTSTTLNSGVYINWPSQASSRIQPTGFVETPSPDLASPHLPFSDLIETPSLNRPLGNWTKRYHWLILREKRGSLEVRGQESSTRYRTPLVLTRSWK